MPVSKVLNDRDNTKGRINVCQHNIAPQMVSEVMTREVATCTPDDNLIRIMAMMTEKRNRHMFVCDNNVLCGVISIGDVVKHRLDEIMREEDVLLKYIDGTGYSG
ncbi:hypothetical protein A9Q94_06375 [Rhodobacterales bacterium 56_14_T64]|nr:hypothetical protein A9Q94_06375 [Rhodobacterales bacterium 56_14_T64]